MRIVQCRFFAIFMLLFAFLCVYLTWNPLLQFGHNYGTKSLTNIPKARIAKVTVLSGFEDILYERALNTHVQHAIRHGYPMYTGRENAVNGAFNKIGYVLSVLLNELFKPADKRVEWLFYFDADSVIMNQEIPLEIFEPPSDYSHIYWLAGKDHNGLNAGVFLLRVSQWSVTLLTRTMTYKHYHPNQDYTFEEQTVLARLTENGDEFKAASLYVPREWFNAYFYIPQEVKPGLILSHFPHQDFKWHIYTWLKVLQSDINTQTKFMYNRPVEETSYLEDINEFWRARRKADRAIERFEAVPLRGIDDETIMRLAEDFRACLEQLKLGADNALELEKLIDQTEESNARLIQVTNAELRDS